MEVRNCKNGECSGILVDTKAIVFTGRKAARPAVACSTCRRVHTDMGTLLSSNERDVFYLDNQLVVVQ